MRITIEIDDDLMAKAQLLNNGETKKATVEKALRLYIAIETQKKLRDLYGKIEVDDIAFQ